MMQANQKRTIDPTRNIPTGYMISRSGETMLAYDPQKMQWVWPGGKRISCQKEARLNCEYLDSIISGESPAVFNESGYVSAES